MIEFYVLDERDRLRQVRYDEVGHYAVNHTVYARDAAGVWTIVAPERDVPNGGSVLEALRADPTKRVWDVAGGPCG